MAAELEKEKQSLSSKKSVQAGAKRGIQSKFARWSFANRYPQLAQFKTGLRDILNAVIDRKFSLFAKQVIVLMVVFLLVKAINGKLVSKRMELKNDIASINMQQNSKEDYLNNKDHLLRLEPLFPDMEQKSGWMPGLLMDLFSRHDLSPKMDGNFTESDQKTYTVVSQNISWQQSFLELGKMLEDMENGDAFLRVSDVTVTKLLGKEDLGKNAVTVKFNTVFPKAKYAQQLFKDYKQQMEKIKAQQEAASKGAGAKTGETK